METRGIDLPLAGRHGGTDKCATGTSPSFAAALRTVTSRCFAPVDPATAAVRAALALPICGRSFSGQLNRAQRPLASSSTALNVFSACICS
jgi:hypothetical protein